MKVVSSLAIALAITTPTLAQNQIPAPTLFSIRGGETLPLHLFASITNDCVSTFTGFDGIDILDGPPEIALKFERGLVSINTVAGKACKPVDGGTIVITAAKGIEEQQKADLTFRVRYRTKHSNSSTWTGRYHLLIFPAAEQASKQRDAGRSVIENKETVTPPIPVRVSRQPSADANRPEQPHHSTIGAGARDAVPTEVLPPNRPLVQPERDLAAPVPTAAIQAPAPTSSPPLALHTTIEDGYRIEEGFFNIMISGSPFLLQGLIVKRANAVGRLPIMLYTHGVTPSMKQRQEMTPRGVKDADLRLVRDYARRGWLGVFVLRRAYGQSDGPDPVTGFKCDSPTPSYQDAIDAAADDLEATLNYIGQREDADLSRIMALGVSGGGAAVVALSTRKIPGLQIVVNVSGGFTLVSCDKNSDRLVEAVRYYGTKTKVSNLWYYAKNDNIFPEQTVTKMREAFLAGGAYAKLVHYPKLIDPSTDTEVDGHELWSKLTSSIMLDVDGYLRNRGLPTWDYNQIKALTEKNGIKTPSNLIELYLAAPGYKALAQSTSSTSSLVYWYRADTLEHAKERAIIACQKRNPGHTCKIIDPPAGQAAEVKRVGEQQYDEPTELTKTELTRTASPTQADDSVRRRVEELAVEASRKFGEVLADTSMLARELQIELKRVGCDAGEVDGVWGDKAKTALSEFTRFAKVALPSNEPSSGVLQAVRNEKGPICPEASQTVDEIKRRVANRPKTTPRRSDRGATEPPRSSWGFCRGSMHYTDKGYSCM